MKYDEARKKAYGQSGWTISAAPLYVAEQGHFYSGDRASITSPNASAALFAEAYFKV